MKLFYQEPHITLFKGNSLEGIPLPDQSVQCCVTSPPYWGLRHYGAAEQIGREETPSLYTERLVAVFREVWRVLRNDGTLWLNLGDTYASAWPCSRQNVIGAGSMENGKRAARRPRTVDGIKEKDLVGIPWLIAFALRADGWHLRSDIIWHKSVCVPESVKDRPTHAHEYIFLLTKRAKKYYYDSAAIEEPQSENERARRLKQSPELGTRYKLFRDGDTGQRPPSQNGALRSADARRKLAEKGTRNKRTVWTVATAGFPEAHTATFPPTLIEPCILAGSRPGDTILDPFNGAGTTGLVAHALGRQYVGIDINAKYLAMSVRRLAQGVLPLGVEALA